MSDTQKAQLNTYLATKGRSLGSIKYSATIHGWSNATFHSLCDSLPGSVAVCKTTNGYIFGGYIGDQNWSGNGGYKTSSDAFTFNLNGAVAKYDVTTTDNAIYTNPTRGPSFGGGQDIYTTLDTKNNYTYKYSYGGGGGGHGYLNGITSGNGPHLTDVEVWSL